MTDRDQCRLVVISAVSVVLGEGMRSSFVVCVGGREIMSSHDGGGQSGHVITSKNRQQQQVLKGLVKVIQQMRMKQLMCIH